MKTLEEILAPLEAERGSALELFDAVPDLIAVRDGLRKLAEAVQHTGYGDFFLGDTIHEPETCWKCIMDKLLGEPPANPKPAAEEKEFYCLKHSPKGIVCDCDLAAEEPRT